MDSTEEFDIEQIINEYGEMVYRLAMVHGKTKEDAEDIFQEVFLRLVKYRSRLKSREHIRNWLIRVTINCGKTHRMKMMKCQTIPLDEKMAADTVNDSSEIEWKVYKAVKSLPEKYRAIIHLYYYEELSIKEISECLKRKEGTVKSQLSRARKLLSRKLGKEFGDEEL